MNFSRNSSVSPTGLSLGNGTINARIVVSSINSNFGVISHRVHVHSVINYVSWTPAPTPAPFPVSEVTTRGTELMRTSRFLSSTSTRGLVFAPSSTRFGSNHEIFSNQPDHNQSVNLLRSTNPGSMNRSDVQNEVRSEVPSEVRSDIERETTELRSDGRIHSLPGYPQGIYRCSKCLATLYSAQKFAAHVQSAHYRGEGKEERRRRMAARCRRRELRLRQSRNRHTAVPVSSGGISKGYAASRMNGVAVGADDADPVSNGVGAAPMRGPLGVAIKEEPM